MIKLGVVLVCLAALSGCSTMFEREYVSVTPHTVASVGENTAITIESHYELVSAILYYVTQEKVTGKVRLSGYTKEGAKDDLNTAIAEVMKETALGSYSVEQITWEINSIVGHLEADLTILYKRSQEELDGVFPVSGIASSINALATAIEKSDLKLSVNRTFSTTDRTQIARIISGAYENSARYLVEIPEIVTTFHPAEGAWKIAEFDIHYQSTEEQLSQKKQALDYQIKSIASKLWAENDDLYQTMFHLVLDGVTITQNGDTPWDILVEKEGSSRGATFALHAVMLEMGIVSQIIEGSYLDIGCTWNLFTTSSGEQMMIDLSRARNYQGDYLYYSSEGFSDRGYRWN